MEKKVALITGASGGIGSSMALDFGENGYKLVLGYNNSFESIADLSKQLESKGYDFICVKADLSNPSDVKKIVSEAIQTFGHIDVLINCAGMSSVKLLIDETDESIKNTIAVNLLGTIYACKEVSKYMLSRKCGKIINISSIWGNFGASNETIYSASKGGINTFTKALAKELAPSGISVNAIAPGVVDTKMMAHFTDLELAQLKEEIPFNRFASPQDISSLVLFLASDKCTYITGQIIQIDGGFCI